jgi:hypothetical protein
VLDGAQRFHGGVGGAQSIRCLVRPPLSGWLARATSLVPLVSSLDPVADRHAGDPTMAAPQERIKIFKVKNHFIFSIESAGQCTAEQVRTRRADGELADCAPAAG